MIGDAIAPASSAAVNIHCAVLRLTSFLAAMIGSSGAPRLLSMDTIRPRQTRVGTNSRSRQPVSTLSSYDDNCGCGAVSSITVRVAEAAAVSCAS